eukprot:759632-Hanusia_phi.AAC.4
MDAGEAASYFQSAIWDLSLTNLVRAEGNIKYDAILGQGRSHKTLIQVGAIEREILLRLPVVYE